MNDKPFAPSAARNSQPILDVLRTEFADIGSVLEIGSGTGQHATYFATELGHLIWQCSDLAAHHDDINAWLGDAALPNVRAPIALDTLSATLPCAEYDAVYSANTAHIMSSPAVEKMFSLVSTTLRDGGIFVLYGPFRQDGKFNAKSNAAFDVSLRQRDPSMGIRDIETLDELGRVGDMERVRLYAMPANNHIGVWARNSRRSAS